MSSILGSWSVAQWGGEVEMTTNKLSQFLVEQHTMISKVAPGKWDNRCQDFSNSGRPRYIWTEYGWVGEFASEQQAECVVSMRNTYELLLSIIERQQEALADLEIAECRYRAAHDLHGDGHAVAGYTWDQMRHAGDRARKCLAEIEALLPPEEKK